MGLREPTFNQKLNIWKELIIFCKPVTAWADIEHEPLFRSRQTDSFNGSDTDMASARRVGDQRDDTGAFL